MSIVLYTNPASSNAMKVRFLLAELGLEYERTHVPISRPRPDWYVEIYPFGTIPFMRDGDRELGESNAMLRYLANREGRHRPLSVAIRPSGPGWTGRSTPGARSFAERSSPPSRSASCRRRSTRAMPASSPP